jgi:hypothetical protein
MSPETLPVSAWPVLAFCAFLIGLSKSGLPGAGILVVPLAAAVLPARASTGLILPILIAGDVFALLRHRRHAEWRSMLRLLPAACVGVVVGYLLMGRVTDTQLRPVIGAIILGLLVLGWIRSRRERDPAPPRFRPGVAVATGLLAGVTTMLANAAGPIMQLYLLGMRLPKAAFIGTGAWYFLVVNGFKVPFSARLGLITTGSLAVNLWLLPAVALGSFAGGRLLAVLPQRSFEMAVRWLTALAALRLLF